MLDVCLPEDSSEDMKSRVSNIISSFGKWPWSLVNDKLIEIGLDSTLVEHLKKFVSHKGAPKRELSQIGSLFLQLAKDRPHVYAKARRAINHLIQLLATLDDFAVPSNRLSFDASLSSTKEYRSGLVFQVVVVVSEAQVKRHCVALGGRYDDIITDFRSQIPRAPNEDHGNFGCAQAVGLSIAIEKLISIVKRPQETSERVRTADVYVIAEDNLRSAKLQMLSRLWDHNLKTDYIHNPELSLHDQKKIAVQNGAKYLVILEGEEQTFYAKGVVSIMDVEKNGLELVRANEVADRLLSSVNHDKKLQSYTESGVILGAVHSTQPAMIHNRKNSSELRSNYLRRLGIGHIIKNPHSP